MADNRNDTTVGDVLKDHFGVNNIREARERRNSVLEQERIEKMNVANGNAPAANKQAQAPVQDRVTYQQIPPVPVPNETSQDTKCPSCGGTLSFDPATGGLVCNFCGNHVELKTTIADQSTGYTLEDLQHNGGRRIQYGVKRIICGTCGGSFVAETSSISGLCPYCGSNSITESTETAGVLEPTGIVPFQIDKENAQAIFKQWISARRFAPMDITKNAQITDLVVRLRQIRQRASVDLARCHGGAVIGIPVCSCNDCHFTCLLSRSVPSPARIPQSPRKHSDKRRYFP